MRTFIHIISLWLLTGFTANAEALQVITSTTDLAALSKAIGGEHVQVKSLTPGSRDPHYAVAKPSMIRQLHRADLLVIVGADLETGWLPALLQSARNPRAYPGQQGHLDLSTHVSLLGRAQQPVSRAMGDVHGQGNPHYWLDPANQRLMARAIKARLASLDPAHADDYRTALLNFEHTLNERMQHWKNQLANLKNQPVIAYHNSFIYLAQAFGFRIVDEIEPQPGIAPSAASLAELVSTIQRQQIALLIMEPYYERRSAQFIQQHTDIKLAVLPQSVGAKEDIKTMFELFDAIVETLTQTLKN